MSGVARTIRMSRPVMSSTPTSYTNGAPKREVGIHNQTLFPEDTHWTLSSAVRLRLREDHVQTSWSVIPIRTVALFRHSRACGNPCVLSKARQRCNSLEGNGTVPRVLHFPRRMVPNIIFAHDEFR